MKVNYSKVIGFQEALELMKSYGHELPDDSYTTDVVDYITGNVAPFQFFLGEKDLEWLMDPSHECARNTFLHNIHIYWNVEMTQLEKAYFAGVENYIDLRSALSTLPRIQHQSLYKRWVDTLPYVKELGVAK